MQRIDKVEIRMAKPEAARENILRNLWRGLPAVTDCGDWRERMPVAIVGSGPSLRDTLPELKKFKNIMAAGSSHDFLVENRCFPTWAIFCDPDPVMAQYVKKPWPHTRYLISSACDEAVFDRLGGYQVFVWHLFNSDDDPEFFKDHNVCLVGGGCTVGTRAMFMAMSFGFTNLHLFGFDNCIKPDCHHAYGDFKDESETLGNIFQVRMENSDKEFTMAGYMLAQLFDVKATLKRYADKIQVTVHGDGAIAELMRLGKPLGA